jgi:hypothetical protein
VAGFHRNRWQVWIGIRFIPATHSGPGWQIIIGIPALRLAGFHRNQWQVWTGIFNKRFRGPQQEFLSAHSHFRNKENKECINECLKSLESTIKVICKEKKIGIGENSTAKTLINTLFENEYIPKYFQSHYSALQSVLESGVPTVRNKVSGHGQGDKIIDVDENYAELILNLTATNIIFLASGIK